MKPEIAALRFIVSHKDIYYISWIIDAAEGIGFLQTDDAKAGKITIFSPKEQQRYLFELLAALRAEGLDIKEDKETEADESDNERQI
ncbi:MAG: DUF4911 domain-containing protein [Synergistes jonesii]|uniref:DUF4911 domain-containing protein n=1 Tax=Synergistes jonesii TaxID=2754 RepID=UPI002A7617DA|nr:DUF4911 domain-containing protein [Synergistes jonesii]MDY2984463.1 DUF4911 domain-containing protein [Synergistes jonesii]